MAVEFALIVPIFLMLVFGMIDFTRAYYTQSAIATAVREGARLGAVMDDPILREDSVKARVRQTAIPFGGSPIDLNSVTVCRASGNPPACDANGGQVLVRVDNYPFNMFTPMAKMIGAGNTYNITRQATFRWERE